MSRIVRGPQPAGDDQALHRNFFDDYFDDTQKPKVPQTQNTISSSLQTQPIHISPDIVKFFDYLNVNTIGSHDIITTPYGDKKITYADFTASGRSLEFIENYITNEVLPLYGNTHTTSNSTGLQSTSYRHEAREIIARVSRASNTEDSVLFHGSGATSCINNLINILNINNIVNNSYNTSTPLPVVLLGPHEHHSNILPWKESGAIVIILTEKHIKPIIVNKDDIFNINEINNMTMAPSSSSSTTTGEDTTTTIQTKRPHIMLDNIYPHVYNDILSSCHLTSSSSSYILDDTISTTDDTNTTVTSSSSSSSSSSTLIFDDSEQTTGTISLSHLYAILDILVREYNPPVIIGAFSICSNVTGIYEDDLTITSILKQYNAINIWDYAGGASSSPIDMNPYNKLEYKKDALYYSPHKFLGGVQTPGVLIVKKYILAKNKIPSTTGGGTVFFSSNSDHIFLENQHEKNEGGTPNIIGAIRAGLTLQIKEYMKILPTLKIHILSQYTLHILSKHPYIQLIGYDNISDSLQHDTHNKMLSQLLFLDQNNINKNTNTINNNNTPIQANTGHGTLLNNSITSPHLTSTDVHSTITKNSGIISFIVYSGINNTDLSSSSLSPTHIIPSQFIAALLNDIFGIQVRSGCLCAGPYSHSLLGINQHTSDCLLSVLYQKHEHYRPGVVRLSLHYSMSIYEIQYIIQSILFCSTFALYFLPLYQCVISSGEWKHHTRRKKEPQRRWLGNITYLTSKMNYTSKRKTVESVLNITTTAATNNNNNTTNNNNNTTTNDNDDDDDITTQQRFKHDNMLLSSYILSAEQMVGYISPYIEQKQAVSSTSVSSDNMSDDHTTTTQSPFTSNITETIMLPFNHAASSSSSSPHIKTNHDIYSILSLYTTNIFNEFTSTHPLFSSIHSQTQSNKPLMYNTLIRLSSSLLGLNTSTSSSPNTTSAVSSSLPSSSVSSSSSYTALSSLYPTIITSYNDINVLQYCIQYINDTHSIYTQYPTTLPSHELPSLSMEILSPSQPQQEHINQHEDGTIMADTTSPSPSSSSLSSQSATVLSWFPTHSIILPLLHKYRIKLKQQQQHQSRASKVMTSSTSSQGDVLYTISSTTGKIVSTVNPQLSSYISSQMTLSTLTLTVLFQQLILSKIICYTQYINTLFSQSSSPSIDHTHTSSETSPSSSSLSITPFLSYHPGSNRTDIISYQRAYILLGIKVNEYIYNQYNITQYTSQYINKAADNTITSSSSLQSTLISLYPQLSSIFNHKRTLSFPTNIPRVLAPLSSSSSQPSSAPQSTFPLPSSIRPNIYQMGYTNPDQLCIHCWHQHTFTVSSSSSSPSGTAGECLSCECVHFKPLRDTSTTTTTTTTSTSYKKQKMTTALSASTSTAQQNQTAILPQPQPSSDTTPSASIPSISTVALANNPVQQLSKKQRKTLFQRLIGNNTSRAMIQFDMVHPGDRILVGVSGGKDSLTLIHALIQIRNSLPFHFDIAAATVDPMTSEYDPSPLKTYFQSLGIDYYYQQVPVMAKALELQATGRKISICAFCSRMRRGILYTICRNNNFNILALGQHLDDFAESFVMSSFHNGTLTTMKPSYINNKGDIKIIRPLCYVRESNTRQYANAMGLPIISENCPACFEAPKERQRVKLMLASQETVHPYLYNNLSKAMFPLMKVTSLFTLPQKLNYLLEWVNGTDDDDNSSSNNSNDDDDGDDNITEADIPSSEGASIHQCLASASTPVPSTPFTSTPAPAPVSNAATPVDQPSSNKQAKHSNVVAQGKDGLQYAGSSSLQVFLSASQKQQQQQQAALATNQSTQQQIQQSSTSIVSNKSSSSAYRAPHAESIPIRAGNQYNDGLATLLAQVLEQAHIPLGIPAPVPRGASSSSTPSSSSSSRQAVFLPQHQQASSTPQDTTSMNDTVPSPLLNQNTTDIIANESSSDTTTATVTATVTTTTTTTPHGGGSSINFTPGIDKTLTLNDIDTILHDNQGDDSGVEDCPSCLPGDICALPRKKRKREE